MKVVATIQIDFEQTPLGTRSRLGDELRGKTILQHTLERVTAAKQVDAVCVLCPKAQFERCKSAIGGLDVVVRPFDAEPAPWSYLVQTARKWSLDGWRGGVGGATYFDEFTDPRLLAGLLSETSAEAVLSLPASAPFLDAGLMDRMIENQRDAAGDIKMTFTQAPPGLAGILLETDLVKELAEKIIPVGWLFGYRPDAPQKDLSFQPCCLDIPTKLRHAVGRLCGDTDRSMRRVAALASAHTAPDLETIGGWLTQYESNTIDPLPREVELEVTTDDPYPNTLLRPRGAKIPPRIPLGLGAIESLVAELSRFDDSLLVLGGSGDPLRHPNIARIIEIACSKTPGETGVYGLAVKTSAVDLGEEIIKCMVKAGVDILDVSLDAWTQELYANLQSPDDSTGADLPGILKKLERLDQLRQEQGSVRPIMVPRLTKCLENVHELDSFFDGWVRRNGAVAIDGYSHCAGQRQDISVSNMSPPNRVTCRRLRSRCVILCDGTVTMCDQDFKGSVPVGNIAEQSLEGIWNGERLAQVRQRHNDLQFSTLELCQACDEWHRP